MKDDFPDEFKEYMVTHHLIHTPTPPDHTHSGIIVFVSKEYEIISDTGTIPGRLMNIAISHTPTKTEYNLKGWEFIQSEIDLLKTPRI